ncbi:acyl-CoA desaturase-like protein [Cricetulus griseus]|nr:acyl-CoA desaturase-like protein [Cricetulus griseus]
MTHWLLSEAMWAHDPCPTDLAPDDGMVSFLIGTKRSVWGSGYFWGETLWNSYFLASILRYTITLEGTWLVNSAAHMYGKQPYDKLSSPWQNPLVGLGAIGEGFYNFYHTFPFDYSVSEFG